MLVQGGGCTTGSLCIDRTILTHAMRWNMKQWRDNSTRTCMTMAMAMAIAMAMYREHIGKAYCTGDQNAFIVVDVDPRHPGLHLLLNNGTCLPFG